MKKFKLFFALFMALAISNICQGSTTTPILSGAEYRVGQGDIETVFSVQPRIVRSNAGDDETIGMKIGGNYFLTDMFSPGLEFDLDAGSGTTFKLLPNVKVYYPSDSRFLPYIQVGFGYMHQSNDNFAAFVIGPGINYMLSNTIAIGAQFRYDLGAGSQTLHEIQFPIQFAIYFKY